MRSVLITPPAKRAEAKYPILRIDKRKHPASHLVHQVVWHSLPEPGFTGLPIKAFKLMAVNGALGICSCTHQGHEKTPAASRLGSALGNWTDQSQAGSIKNGRRNNQGVMSAFHFATGSGIKINVDDIAAAGYVSHLKPFDFEANRRHVLPFRPSWNLASILGQQLFERVAGYAAGRSDNHALAFNGDFHPIAGGQVVGFREKCRDRQDQRAPGLSESHGFHRYTTLFASMWPGQMPRIIDPLPNQQFYKSKTLLQKSQLMASQGKSSISGFSCSACLPHGKPELPNPRSQAGAWERANLN